MSIARFLLCFIYLFPISASAAPTASLEQTPSADGTMQSANQSTVSDKNKSSQTENVIQDRELNHIQLIAQTGARHLALLNLDKQQVLYSDEPMRWIEWERERIRLLNLTKQYTLLIKRLRLLPKDINGDFLYWARSQQASAYFKLQEYASARAVLRTVIWANQTQGSEFTLKWLPHWRRMLIHSYLNEHLFKDAHTAITRFRQDYGQGDINDIILYARVLLMNNLADDALTLLSPFTRNPEAGMLHLLAQLRKDKRSPRIVLQASLRQMQGEWVQPELRIYLWSIVAEAAQRSDDRLSAIKAMEFVLADMSSQELPKGLFKLNVDDLWNAYIDNALKIGNKAQYLIGDDIVWLNAAEAIGAIQPINARSLYAFLILRGQDQSVKKQAAKLFLASLTQQNVTTDRNEDEKSSELIRQLFLNSKNFAEKNTVPIVIRHFLVDYILRQGNIRVASELMASIKTSPQGADKFMWALRRSRVLVMGGNAKESAQALTQLLSQQQSLSLEDMDKLMQVVFDLQTVNAHQYAVTVFNKVIKNLSQNKKFNDEKVELKDPDYIKLRREIYYWMADSKRAQKQYVMAANLYLKSAMFHSEGLDPWGQTAHYQAANNLAKAGLLEDARALYAHLLDTTKEESHRKVLKHELQQLGLLENKATATE